VYLLGVEFLVSTQAFYCSLCDVFLGSCTCAETHCKSDEHNEKYAVSIAVVLCCFEAVKSILHLSPHYFKSKLHLNPYDLKPKFASIFILSLHRSFQDIQKTLVT